MKKIFAILLAILIMAFCGCSNSRDDTTENTTATNDVSKEESTDAVDAEEKISQFFKEIFDNHTIKENDSGEKVAVLTVPDFQKLSELFSEDEEINIDDCILLAKKNPDVTKELQVKLSSEDEENIREILEDAFIFDMLVNSIGSVDIDLSDPAERTKTEAEDENN